MTDADINHPAVLLTGPTRGLGKALVDALVTHPSRCELILVGRDPGALARVADHARAQGTRTHEVAADFADLRQVTRAAAEIVAAVGQGELPEVTAYLANAGAQMADRRQVGAQGHELTFSVNVLAQHGFLRALRPALAPEGHVIFLVSSTHRGQSASYGLTPSPKWRDPEQLATPDLTPDGATGKAGGRAYADSKLALVTLAHAWASELSGEQRVNVYDPGLMPGTGLARQMPGYKRWAWEHVMPVMRVLPGAASPRASARYAAALALGDTHRRLTDGYVHLGRVTDAAAQTHDEQRQRRLWEVMEALTSQPGVLDR